MKTRGSKTRSIPAAKPRKTTKPGTKLWSVLVLAYGERFSEFRKWVFLVKASSYLEAENKAREIAEQPYGMTRYKVTQSIATLVTLGDTPFYIHGGGVSEQETKRIMSDYLSMMRQGEKSFQEPLKFLFGDSANPPSTKVRRARRNKS